MQVFRQLQIDSSLWIKGINCRRVQVVVVLFLLSFHYLLNWVQRVRVYREGEAPTATEGVQERGYRSTGILRYSIHTHCGAVSGEGSAGMCMASTWTWNVGMEAEAK